MAVEHLMHGQASKLGAGVAAGGHMGRHLDIKQGIKSAGGWRNRGSHMVCHLDIKQGTRWERGNAGSERVVPSTCPSLFPSCHTAIYRALKPSPTRRVPKRQPRVGDPPLSIKPYEVKREGKHRPMSPALPYAPDSAVTTRIGCHSCGFRPSRAHSATFDFFGCPARHKCEEEWSVTNVVYDIAYIHIESLKPSVGGPGLST